MATNPDVVRVRERGLSLIEALVIVTITALLALLLLPMVSRAASRNFALAENAVDAAAAGNAETEYRTLMRAAAGRVVNRDRAEHVEGRAESVVFFPNLAAPAACALDGAPQYVRLRIAPEGRLLCESDGRRREMLRWSNAAARFSFSADGRSWSTTWSAASHAPLVRFELESEGRRLTWVERAGAEEPPATDQSVAP